MLNFIKKYFRKGLVGKLKIQEKGMFLSFSQIHSISFVYLLESSAKIEEFQNIVDIFNKTEIPYKGLIIEGEKNLFARNGLENNNNLKFLSVNDMNWLGVPKNDAISDFMNAASDLFICCGDSSNFTTEYVTAVSKCHFKIDATGLYNVDYFTLSLKQPENSSLSAAQMLEQLITYLKTIKTNLAFK